MIINVLNLNNLHNLYSLETGVLWSFICVLFSHEIFCRVFLLIEIMYFWKKLPKAFPNAFLLHNLPTFLFDNFTNGNFSNAENFRIYQVRVKLLQLEGFLKIDTLCFELSHSIESSLRSLPAM